MSLYDDLKDLEHVKNHPLIKRSEGWADRIRENKKRHAQQMTEDYSQSREEIDYSYIPEGFSESFGQTYLSNRQMTADEIRINAYEIVRDSLNQFDLPLRPVISYNNTKNLKLAQEGGDKVVSGSIIFNVDFRTLTGARVASTVVVPISKGVILNPSMIDLDGASYVLSQSTIDRIVGRNTAYAKDPIQKNIFSPPMSAEERVMAVEIREERGYQPREMSHNGDYLGKIESSVKGVPSAYPFVKADLEKAESDGTDTFPRLWEYVYHTYILNHVSEADKDHWFPHLVNDGFVINPLDVNRGRRRAQQNYQPVENQDPSPKDIDYSQKGTDLMYPNTKTPVEIGDKVKFEGQEGLINGTVEGFSGDKIRAKSNKGYIYELELREIRPLPSTFKKMYLVGELSPKVREDFIRKNKRVAQAILPDTGDTFGEPNTEYTEFLEDEPTGIETMDDLGRFYSGTIMPIEVQDRVKFEAKGGPIRGLVSDFGSGDHSDFVYVDKDDLTYRVHFEDIEPLTSTYKKMWMAPSNGVEGE
jgi:hypothetical protein